MKMDVSIHRVESIEKEIGRYKRDDGREFFVLTLKIKSNRQNCCDEESGIRYYTEEKSEILLFSGNKKNLEFTATIMTEPSLLTPGQLVKLKKLKTFSGAEIEK